MKSVQPSTFCGISDTPIEIDDYKTNLNGADKQMLTNFLKYRRGYTTKEDVLKFIDDLENDPDNPNGGGKKATASEDSRFSLSNKIFGIDIPYRNHRETKMTISDILREVMLKKHGEAGTDVICQFTVKML